MAHTLARRAAFLRHQRMRPTHACWCAPMARRCSGLAGADPHPALSFTVDPSTAVARITLTNARRTNPLSRGVMERANWLLRYRVAPRPDEIAAVVIAAEAGSAWFSSGHDLGDVFELDADIDRDRAGRAMRPRSKTQLFDLFETCSKLMLTLRGLPQPTVAVVAGQAASAGLQLAASCDGEPARCRMRHTSEQWKRIHHSGLGERGVWSGTSVIRVQQVCSQLTLQPFLSTNAAAVSSSSTAVRSAFEAFWCRVCPPPLLLPSAIVWWRLTLTLSAHCCPSPFSIAVVLASSSASFSAPGSRRGRFCHTPGVALAERVGHSRALEMLLLGDVWSAKEAQAYGLVTRVVAPEELDRAAAAVAASLTLHGRGFPGYVCESRALNVPSERPVHSLSVLRLCYPEEY